MRFVDLSTTIEPSPEGTPPFLRVGVEYRSHAEGAAHASALLKVPASAFRNSEGWATETLTLGTHDSTHVDAPWHYNSVIGGKPASAIDELPLEWFFGDGIVLDMTAKAEGDAVTVDDIVAALLHIDHEIKPLDIVLIRTGRDAFLNSPDYVFRGCGVTAEATRWLYEKGVRVMGIDAWGWDAPLDRQAREAVSSGKDGILWAAHQVDLPYAHIERLVNLAALPPKDFKVACFPLKVKHGSAGPARIVAILP